MITIQRLETSIAELPSSSLVVYPSDSQDNTIALHLRAAGSLFFWAKQLVSYQRREAMHALYAFRRQVDDIADGDAIRVLKQVLHADWCSEIALLYGECRSTRQRAP